MVRHFTGNIYIGNIKDASDRSLLDDNNIKSILNVCSDVDTPYHAGILLYKAGLDDPKDTLAPRNAFVIPTAVRLLAAIAFTARVKLKGNALVHCAAGHNRSALVAAIYARDILGMELKRAIELAQVKDQKHWMADLGYSW